MIDSLRVRCAGDWLAARHRVARRSRQSGFGAVVMIVLVAGIGAAAALFSFSRPNQLPLDNVRKTTDVLAVAKDALIGYALSRGQPKCSIVEDFGTSLEAQKKQNQCEAEGRAERPGELPCPDVTGDGVEDTPCNSPTGANLIGRLPWKTLGIAELRDADGEPLWYLLSGPFRKYASNPLPAGTESQIAAKHINSDTRGNIVVYSQNPATGAVVQVTNTAVAVIFAPGSTLGNQNRGAASVLCSLIGSILSSSLCPSAYLESLTARSSPPLNGPFFDVTLRQRSGTSNDSALYITTGEFIAAVETRVGNEIRYLLTEYEQNSTCRCLPWADNWPYSGGIADEGQNRGRLGTHVGPEQWGTGGLRPDLTPDPMPRLPPWIGANNWNNLIWYSVSGLVTPPGTCKTFSTTPLNVDGTRVAALFFMPGTPRDGIARLLPLFGTRADTLALFLHDPANNDAANVSNPACPDVGDIGLGGSPSSRPGEPACDAYTKPTSTARDRNRLYMIGAATKDTCEKQAARLLSLAPCGVGFQGNSVNPECVDARMELRLCSCSEAAATIASLPACRQSLNSQNCDAPIAALKTCGL